MASIEERVSRLLAILRETPLGWIAAELEEELRDDGHGTLTGEAQLFWAGNFISDKLKLELAAQEELRALEDRMDLPGGVEMLDTGGDGTIRLAAPERSEAISAFLTILWRWLEDPQGSTEDRAE